MAVISKIRNRSALLITVIGVAMGLFVLGDLLGSGSGLFQQQETNIAEIRGKKISFQEFEAMVQKEIGSETVDERGREQVRQRVWDILLQENIMFEEYDELGLSVSPEELFEQVKMSSRNSIMAQYFTNPQTGQIYEQFRDPVTGGLNTTNVLSYIKQVLQSDQAESWLPVERAIKIDRLSRKYSNLIRKGLEPTPTAVQKELTTRSKKVTFQWVGINYASVEDSEVEVSDSDLKKYYNEHKDEERFQQKETTRGIEYLVFNVEPTAKDVASLREEMLDLKSDFATADNDTTFVNDYADTPFNIRFFRKGQLPEEIDSLAFEVEKDTVFGPFEDNNFFKLSKVIGSKISSDSARARHILLEVTEGDTAATLALADSLKQVIKANNNFAQLALQYSIDKASAEKGGDLDWFTEGRMVKPFNDAVFEGEEGDMPIVTSQFGVHLIEIQEKTKEVEKVLVATVNREIRPSKNTYDAVFNEASKFSINNNTVEKFRTEGGNMGIQTAAYIKEGDKTLGRLESPRPLIRWAYEAEKGNVSEPFEMDQKFVVAALTNIRPEGTLPFDEVKEQILTDVLNKKKAEYLISQIEGQNSLEQIANTWNSEVKSASEVTFANFTIGGMGPEGAVIGTLFSIEPNVVSQPIEGNRGVYVVKVINVVEDNLLTAENVEADLTRSYVSRVDFETFNALKEKANIEDNRAKFY